MKESTARQSSMNHAKCHVLGERSAVKKALVKYYGTQIYPKFRETVSISEIAVLTNSKT